MISLTQNMDIVTTILWTPEIWDAISVEGTEKFHVPYQDDCMYYLVNDTQGVVIFHPFKDGLKIHPNFPKKHRGKVAYKAIEQSIQDVFRQGCGVVYAEVEPELKHVIWCAKALGFKSMDGLLVRRKLDS